MKARAYAMFGSLVIGALAWAHFVGWAPTQVDEIKRVPQSIRANPGSYRAAYGGVRSTGAK